MSDSYLFSAPAVAVSVFVVWMAALSIGIYMTQLSPDELKAKRKTEADDALKKAYANFDRTFYTYDIRLTGQQRSFYRSHLHGTNCINYNVSDRQLSPYIEYKHYSKNHIFFNDHSSTIDIIVWEHYALSNSCERGFSLLQKEGLIQEKLQPKKIRKSDTTIYLRTLIIPARGLRNYATTKRLTSECYATYYEKSQRKYIKTNFRGYNDETYRITFTNRAPYPITVDIYFYNTIYNNCQATWNTLLKKGRVTLHANRQY